MSITWYPIKERALLKVSGKDALRFLNGQLTNDIKSLDCDHSMLAGLLNAKGKFVSELWVRRIDGAFIIDISSSDRDAVHRRLENFIVADDVSIEPYSEDWRGYYVVGESIVKNMSDTLFYSYRWGISGYEIWSDAPISFLQREAELSDHDVLVRRVEKGIAEWRTDFDETYFPQEAGWNENYGLHFHKGCYIGQEIVSRLQHVGHVNRQVKRLICLDRLSEGDGSYLVSRRLSCNGQEIATMTSLVYSQRYQAWIGLATIPRAYWEQRLDLDETQWEVMK
ncbi:MAG: hypothetical protein NZM04_00100 [Methylacidiphilales bacterium]|nr:hypothetical protein [Candidatus Methylacidiphilales bacterium]MDW8348853.1 hypothetical protein [Verrucomicrobiae bacterium]